MRMVNIEKWRKLGKNGELAMSTMVAAVLWWEEGGGGLVGDR